MHHNAWRIWLQMKINTGIVFKVAPLLSFFPLNMIIACLKQWIIRLFLQCSDSTVCETPYPPELRARQRHSSSFLCVPQKLNSPAVKGFIGLVCSYLTPLTGADAPARVTCDGFICLKSNILDLMFYKAELKSVSLLYLWCLGNNSGHELDSRSTVNCCDWGAAHVIHNPGLSTHWESWWRALQQIKRRKIDVAKSRFDILQNWSASYKLTKPIYSLYGSANIWCWNAANGEVHRKFFELPFLRFAWEPLLKCLFLMT